jgi:hypothetical protein
MRYGRWMQDPGLLSLCLEGFLYAFQISSMFYLDLQKNGQCAPRRYSSMGAPF